MRAKDLIIILAVVVIWGVNFVALRVGLNGVPPMLLVCLRFVLSALPAVFLVRRPATPFRYLFWYGMFMGVGQYSLLYGALKLGMPAGLSSIVIQTQSFFTLGFAVWLLGERVKPNQIVGMLIAFGGLSLIALAFDATVGVVSLAMCVGAACAWGLANVITKKASLTPNPSPFGRGELDALSFLVWASLIPPLPMLALSLLIEGPQQIGFVLTHLSITSIAAMAFTAYLSTLFGFAMWNRMIARHGAAQVAPFSLLVPIFGLVSTAIVLGEQITPIKLVAGVLVMAGLVVFVFGGRIAARLVLAARPI
jgi:O-acetylserine/cysteine efflux transporter